MLNIIFLFLVLASASLASVRGTPEQSLARGIEHNLWKYRQFISTEPVVSWEQLEQVDRGLYGINAALRTGSVTEFFSFVPLDQRPRFPLGDLILVQSTAMPWPDAWKTEDREKPGDYLPHRSHQEIRFFIYEKDGKFIADRWYETKFQAMLAETGLTVPPPTPYYPPPPTPPGENPTRASPPAGPVVSATTAPTVAPGATTTPAPGTPPAKSSPPLWWIAGAGAAVVAVVLAVRRKRPKA
jgi:hypothetical protein